MKIKINEVWNREGRTLELAIIETSGNPVLAIWDWITEHRPDLLLADTLYSHGYHAVQI